MSSNELQPTGSHDLVPQQGSPFGTGRALAGVNAGSVSIEQERAIAEVQGQIIVAQRCPRDLNKVHAEVMAACKSKSFAAAAFYSVPNRGSGPSIRFAEQIAASVGNFQFGHREIGRTEGKSEIEVFAWDVEKNNRSIRQITVMHVTDTKNGPKVLRDQADIDNRIANVASKQMRGRILAILPKWLVEDAIQECRKTLAGNTTEPIEVRVRRMAEVFKTKFGVSLEMLETYSKKKSAQFVTDDLVELQGVFNALKDGAKVGQYFGDEALDDDDTPPANEAVLAAGKALAASQAAKPTAAPPAPAKQAEKQAPQETPADAPEPEAATPPPPPPPAPAQRARKAATPPPPAPAPEPEPEQQAQPEQQDDGAGGPPPDNGDPGPQSSDYF